MLDPKTFSRKLDFLLTKISRDKTAKNFLFSIVTELEKVFGDDLHIDNGRIYEEDEDSNFMLIHPPQKANGTRPAEKLLRSSEGVRRLLKHSSYIYDEWNFSIDQEISKQQDYTVPAAILVHSPTERWIFVFELKSGWVREEVEFTLNAVRTMLDYRLMADAVQSEMERAVHIQQSLLPSGPPEIEGYEIAARSQPAELVGGDLYDYIIFDNKSFGICIGDASGHGMPAALLVRDVVTGLRMGLEKEMKMVYTLKKLNRVIYRSTYSSAFISLFYGELESNGNLIYVNAGHPAPFLVSGERVRELGSSGLILGALPDIQLSRDIVRILPGDVLVLYTDGLFERENGVGQQFGLRRLRQFVLRNAAMSAQELVEAVFEEVYAFGNRQKWSDDASLMVVKKLAQQ